MRSPLISLAPASRAIASIRPSTCAGTPESIFAGGSPSRSGHFSRTRSWLPPMPPVVTTTAWARSSNSPASSRLVSSPAVGRARRQQLAAHAGDGAAARRPARRRGGGSAARPAARDRLAHPALERRHHAGAGAPGDVEARHRVAVAVGVVAAALGPARVGDPAHALAVQPRALLAGAEAHVGLGPLARPLVLGPVEGRGAHPVLQRQLVGVLDAHPALLGAVDEHQPAQRPERLAAQVRLGLLVEQEHLLAGVGQLGGGHQPGQAAADHDHVGVVAHARGAGSGQRPVAARASAPA